ncbi:MAG: YeeE/YedE family protein [Ferruginibacter sp.]|nr:YeeE/YedE family protein [Ferruginibacter sp.]
MQTKLIKQTLANTDFEVRSLDNLEAAQPKKESIFSYLKYLLMGLFFGVILVKSEVISWYRIQEMFRLQSFHMFGVIGSAVVTGIMSIWLIKKFKIKTISGQQIELPAKEFQKGQIYGGLIFGFGWAITGACPGPLFAQIGSGFGVIIVTLLSAVAGTWMYGLIREKLPH